MLRATHARHVIADEPDPEQVARRLQQVKPDLPQIHALRAARPIQHPGRQRLAADGEDTQLTLDF
ncbi:hypothetical protein [Nocardia sp. NPDC006630]|uniref:hypothetical protein n=1 Tax=Nocardia sp. NPDC006630 TaxID=3157181 RepID=UPI0033B38547